VDPVYRGHFADACRVGHRDVWTGQDEFTRRLTELGDHVGEP